MLFAGDQKIEHLNDDFYGEGIAADDADPEHLFKIASQAEIGVFATQLGLISLYGNDYPDIPYLVKLNSKTNLVKTAQQDPLSTQMIDVRQVVEFKKNTGLNILGVGYTVYLGSEYENAMIREAAQAVHWAHHHGLLTVLWIYPRGKAVKDEKAPELIAGATGVAAMPGQRFRQGELSEERGAEIGRDLQAGGQARRAGPRWSAPAAPAWSPRRSCSSCTTRSSSPAPSGNATGRNIHQKPLDEAVRLANAVTAITVYGKSVDEAFKVYLGKETKN